MPLLTMALTLGWMGMAVSADLSGGQWRPSAINAEGIAAETRIYVAFSEDGKVTGFGGCNRFFGGYTVSGDSIKIGPLASTRKGCPDTLNLEVEFFSALQSAETSPISPRSSTPKKADHPVLRSASRSRPLAQLKHW